MGVTLNVNFRLDKNVIPQFIDGVQDATHRALFDAANYTVQAVEPHTPYDPENGGRHLNQPVVRQYGQNSIYIQWLANNKGFYYGPIQNETLYEHYSTHPGPGFMDEAGQMLPPLALDFIERYMPKL